MSGAAPAPSRALRPDGQHEALVPLDVRGRFATARRVVFVALMAIYLAIPFVVIGGHPAVHLDVPARRFYLFGGSFNAQDVWLVALLLLGFLAALLLVTAWRGRLWCGWACPQTVFLEALYRPIERLFEGSRAQRLRAAGKPRTPARVARTAAKQVVFVALSLGLGHAALIPFVPLGTMPGLFRDGPAAHPIAFGWAMALSALCYLDFAWFREQFCLVLCPYGRMQSVLHDGDSIVIGYDARRGEPRGPIRRPALRVVNDETPPPSGACVDCKKCVWACPTGIDIRNGFQMECIACTQCIDVCDEVMDKVGRPRGLIRYAAQNELEGRPTRVLRPRLVVYAALAALALVAFGANLALRASFEATLLRPAGVPWVIEGDRVRNQVDVHLVNKSSEPHRYRLALEVPAGMRASLDRAVIALPSLGDVRVPVVLLAGLASPGTGAASGPPAVHLVVHELDSGREARLPVRFLSPPGVALAAPVP